MNAARVLDAEPFVARAAAWIQEQVTACVARQGRCNVVLSGGSTPAPVYGALAAAALDWDAITLYFGDERCVPPDDPDSNYRMVEEALLSRLSGARPTVHRMRGEAADHDEAARCYEALLPERIDLVILGMGGDGHTASLFPGSPALEERKRRVVAATSPVAPHARLTLTPVALRAARCCGVLVRGADKAARVAEALEGPVDPRRLPVQLVEEATWILDAAAAGDLSRRSDTDTDTDRRLCCE